MSGNRTGDEEDSVFLTDLNNFEILGGATDSPIMSGHLLVFPYSSRGRASTNRTSSPVHHVPVTVRLTIVAVTLHVTLKTFSFCGSDHVNPLTVLEKSSARMTLFLIRKIGIAVEAKLFNEFFGTGRPLLCPGECAQED